MKNEEIEISVEAYFSGDNLTIDGYDIGKRVEEYWGDSDYEYMLTIPPPGVEFLFRHLGVDGRNRGDLLLALAQRFNTNSCYSDISRLLEQNNIRCEGFTWT